MSNNITQLCKDLEHFETPEWAARAILKKEILTHHVIDPCCGSGILCEAVIKLGQPISPYDIHDWGYPGTHVQDFLKLQEIMPSKIDFTVFMNPPFSLADQFVEKSFELGAHKIVCFQRFAWWESNVRKDFWARRPPNRIYVCGDRATCWDHSIPKDQREGWIDPKTGKRRGGTSTAHAWFVWEKGHPPGTLLGHIYKDHD